MKKELLITGVTVLVATLAALVVYNKVIAPRLTKSAPMAAK